MIPRAHITAWRSKAPWSTGLCVLGPRKARFQIDSPWHSGAADVLTYEPEELLGTKLRALYQRKKGRDLFDLSEALIARCVGVIDEPRDVQGWLLYTLPDMECVCEPTSCSTTAWCARRCA